MINNVKCLLCLYFGWKQVGCQSLLTCLYSPDIHNATHIFPTWQLQAVPTCHAGTGEIQVKLCPSSPSALDISAIPWLLCPLKRDPAPIVQVTGWASGLVWMSPENHTPIAAWTLDHPTSSMSLHCLHFPSHIPDQGNVNCVKYLMCSYMICKPGTFHRKVVFISTVQFVQTVHMIREFVAHNKHNFTFYYFCLWNIVPLVLTGKSSKSCRCVASFIPCVSNF
jgi:hypothetical protein